MTLYVQCSYYSYDVVNMIKYNNYNLLLCENLTFCVGVKKNINNIYRDKINRNLNDWKNPDQICNNNFFVFHLSY